MLLSPSDVVLTRDLHLIHSDSCLSESPSHNPSLPDSPSPAKPHAVPKVKRPAHG
jgi:hypothetical protein